MKADKDNRNPKRLLEFVVRSVPHMEAPPFFASRVANIAQVEKHSFAGSLQAFSRRMIPAFAALLTMVCLVIYEWNPPDPVLESAAFYEEEYLADAITLEYVVASLTLASGDEDENY
jgi:hypothetical protein